jgi:dihydroflavonol-4-reductase
MHQTKKVLIAGGTGFLGYHATHKFLEKGIEVDVIALSDGINLTELFPKEVTIHSVDLFTISEEDIRHLIIEKNYDTFVYALGPDDRTIPSFPAFEFFYEKLVVQCKKVATAAKKASIKRFIVLNSYYSYFDRIFDSKLSKYHPYIRARIKQEEELFLIGEEGTFDVMMLELPFIFGVMPQRAPLWKEFFLDHFSKLPIVFFPKGGQTAVIEVSGVAEAIVAASFYGSNKESYQVGKENMSYQKILKIMLQAIDNRKRIVMVPAWIAAIGGWLIDRRLRKSHKESGLNHRLLMSQILNQSFYIDSSVIESKLHYELLGFCGGKDVTSSIIATMRACYHLPNKP